ncbi:MAG: septum formation initiator family protein [Spirochaetaceae bacterium]|jgi:cell division protein FtsB|nr:septum formation initiator family protein [Spirochaetaceae bacterium]
MKFGKYLFVPWLILAVYTVLSLYNGVSGVVPYRELLWERRKILENLDKLQMTNKQLEGIMDALLYDSETIRIKARELGYGERDERFIRIVGLPGVRRSELRPGTIRTAAQPRHGSVKAYRLFACCTGLILLALFVSWDVLQQRGAPGQRRRIPRTTYP